MKVFYSSDYVSSSGRIDTVKKSRWISKQIRREGGTLDQPRLMSAEDAKVLHDPYYVDDLFAVRKTSATQSALGSWDASLLKSIQASNGGVLSAVETALKEGIAGSLSSGLHHANYDRGKGFCTINGLALGAIQAVKAGKIVGILDVDAHCGGGTFDLLSHPNVMSLGEFYSYDISSNDYDSENYDPSKVDPNRFVLLKHQKEPGYLQEVQRALDFFKSKNVNFLMHNAGMDSMTDDDFSEETMEEREEMVADWCVANRVSCCWVLAGGYVSSKDHVRNVLETTEDLNDPDLSQLPKDHSRVTREVLVELHMKTYRAMKKAFEQLKPLIKN
jgi:acetoin utilization deacetylase AcuC-like enzyme